MDRYARRMLALSVLSIALCLCGAARTDVETKTRELKDLQRALKDKRLEKERCLLEEKCTRSELSVLDKEIARLQKEGERLRRGIVSAERNLTAADRAFRAAAREKKYRTVRLTGGVDLCFRQHQATPVLFGDPVVARQSLEVVHLQKQSLAIAQERESASRRMVDRWQTAERQLLTQQARQQEAASVRAAVKNKKKEQLSAAIQRRMAADEEIKRLQESAKALQQLIIRLERARKKETDAPARKKKLIARRRALRWPVAGKVVGTFGRSKHPELDTVVISNGIKVLSRPGASVVAVEKGVVLFSGQFRSYGLMVIVDHGGGICSIYGHLGSSSVAEDQNVAAGAVIGRTASSETPLYFEIRSDGQPEDPLLWLKGSNQ